MKKTNLYFDDRQSGELARLAREQGVSRAEVVRRLIDHVGREGNKLENQLDAIEKSFGVLAGGTEVTELDRGRDERAAHLERLPAVILVDSDVLMAHLRGLDAARLWLRRAAMESGPVAISPVTVTEVAGGMRSAERREVTRLLSSMIVFPVTERIGWQAAHYMRRYCRSHSGIGLGDYLIAATAETEGLELATLNVEHFPMIPGLRAPFALPL